MQCEQFPSLSKMTTTLTHGYMVSPSFRYVSGCLACIPLVLPWLVNTHLIHRDQNRFGVGCDVRISWLCSDASEDHKKTLRWYPSHGVMPAISPSPSGVHDWRPNQIIIVETKTVDLIPGL